MLSENDIRHRLTQIREQIAQACDDSGRSRDAVKLLAVSKTFPLEAVRVAYQTGQSDFGENYLQEALDKVEQFPDPVWHFIGAIQSNKTRQIAGHFDWVHSVGSFKVARRLSEQRDPSLPPLNVLFQVNTSGEASKSGVTPEQLTALVGDCRDLPNIQLRGLMTIPAAGADPGPAFRLMRSLKDDLASDLPGFTELSMGMTQDFPVAIAEGATWIRVGTGIFGARDYPENKSENKPKNKSENKPDNKK